MIWGAVTGVLNLSSSSGLPTGSTITSPDKAAVFPSFYERTFFIASSLPSPSSDTFYLAYPHSPPPSEKWLLASLPTSPHSDIFLCTPPVTTLPLKALSWYLPDCLHFDALDFLAFALLLYGIKLALPCLPFSSLLVMFLEHLVLCLTCYAGNIF